MAAHSRGWSQQQSWTPDEWEDRPGMAIPAQSLTSIRPALYHRMPTFTCLGHQTRGPTQVRPRGVPKGSCSPTHCGYRQCPGHTVSFEWPWPQPLAAEEAGWFCLWRLLWLPGSHSVWRCGLSHVGSTRMIPVSGGFHRRRWQGHEHGRPPCPLPSFSAEHPQGGGKPLFHFHLVFGAISPNSIWPILFILLTKF